MQRRHFGKSLVWLAIGLLAATPLGGCRPDPAAQSEQEKAAEALKKKQEEAARADFELVRLSTRPNNITSPESLLKPGHWASATLEARANNFDFHGELIVEPVDVNGRPLGLPGMPYALEISRPVVLSKGRKKYLELTLFAPADNLPTDPAAASNMARFQTRLLSGPGGRSLINTIDAAMQMPAHQYYFVVLADSPDDYGFLKQLDSVQAPTGEFVDVLREAHYRVMTPHIRNRTPLPSHPLEWTAIAYLLWDDLPPGSLTPEQQQALVDWLHMGGQLIISGPDTLDTLAGGFLDPYLPVQPTGTRDVTEADFDALNAAFPESVAPLTIEHAWSGVAWTVRRGAAEMPAAGRLVAERRVGRGRVVVTAFRLAQRELRAWPGFDGFLNAYLLKRPARRFHDDGGLVSVRWAEGPMFDAHKVSAVRLFTRDVADVALEATAVSSPREDVTTSVDQPIDPLAAPTLSAGSDPTDGPGAAGWNDFGAVAMNCRDSLRNAAGIVVPDASFVMWVLGAYVLVLAPLNWAAFRLVGRVEWAWVAAPLIAVGFAALVVRLAQLDIGFARAQTELAVVEIHGDYERAHVTRYTALYTSLATNYQITFDDPGALVLPLPANANTESVRGQRLQRVTYRRGETTRLENFSVSSNATGLLHSESMFPLAGPIRFERTDAGARVINESLLMLAGAAVIGPEGAAWLGDVSPGDAVEINFQPLDDAKGFYAQRSQSDETASEPNPGALHLLPLVELAERTREPNETRLVAWSTEPLAGAAFDPPAAQQRQGAVIVVHLDYGSAAPPRLDVNSRARFAEASP